MPNAKYLELQNEFYALTFETKEARQARRIELQERFDPLWKHKPVARLIWGTQDNRMIPIPFMRETHMRNAYRHVYRRVAAVIYLHEHGKDREIDISQWNYDIYYLDCLRAEFQRRKVTVPPEDPKIRAVDAEIDQDYGRDDEWEGPFGWWG